MATETERKDPSRGALPTLEEKLLQIVFGSSEHALNRSDAGPGSVDGDQVLFDALDTISDSFESNIVRWNEELDLIEEALSRSTVLQGVEAAQ